MSHLLQKYPSERAPTPASIGVGLLFRHPYHNCRRENIIDFHLKYSIFIEADVLWKLSLAKTQPDADPYAGW